MADRLDTRVRERNKLNPFSFDHIIDKHEINKSNKCYENGVIGSNERDIFTYMNIAWLQKALCESNV